MIGTTVGGRKQADTDSEADRAEHAERRQRWGTSVRPVAAPEPMANPRVLLVDDDPEGDGIDDELRLHGYGVERVHRGRDVLSGPVDADLVLLRWGLSDLHSVQVCRCLRAVSGVGIVAVGGHDSEMERVLSLQAGADDHLTSPYGMHELFARIQAVLRRLCPAAETVEVGALRIDRVARLVTVGHREAELTRKEFDLLWMLASKPDAVVTREQLMVEVWEDDSGVATRTIDTHLSTLRAKLGPRVPITTVRGVGFRLQNEAARHTEVS